jgi:hypothetical protein
MRRLRPQGLDATEAGMRERLDQLADSLAKP